MSEHAAREIELQLEAGPHPDEDFFRLRVSGAEQSKHVNVTPAELAGIRLLLAGKLPVPHDPSTLAAWLDNARRRIVDDSDAYADEDIIRGLVQSLTGELLEAPDPDEFGDLAVGQKVALKADIERYPHFRIPCGWTGEVVELTDQLVRVKMDRHVDGAESWDNELAFTPEDNNREPWDARVAATEWLLPLVS